MKLIFAFSGILMMLLAGPATTQPTRRSLPDDNLAYPILITIKNETGSGFYLNAPKGVYLVTAKHVLLDQNTGKLKDTSFRLLSYAKDPSDPMPNIVTVDTTKVGATSVIGHPAQDVAVMKLFERNQENPSRIIPVPGVIMRSMAKNGIVGVGMDTTTKKFAEVLVGNEVILMGYPTSLGLQKMPQIDPMRPLLRKGIIAGLNPQSRSIILDCPVYFGNSGGPVIEVDPDGMMGFSYRIIGVVSQYVPYADGGKTFAIMTNSGYSVATPMDFVLDLIK
ncbi:MAG: trypsin-like peptidase domain-containing protein [Bryobacteraceae bacterium]|nr:trypsin-like peptidase domain-containing protein [Bryobacteraceae bacterium]